MGAESKVARRAQALGRISNILSRVIGDELDRETALQRILGEASQALKVEIRGLEVPDEAVETAAAPRTFFFPQGGSALLVTARNEPDAIALAKRADPQVWVMEELPPVARLHVEDGLIKLTPVK